MKFDNDFRILSHISHVMEAETFNLVFFFFSFILFFLTHRLGKKEAERKPKELVLRSGSYTCSRRAKFKL